MSLNKVFAVLVTFVFAASARAAEITRAQYVMGTVLEITADGPGAAAAVDEAFAEVRRWDARLSLYKKDSELSRLNASAAQRPFACTPEVWSALQDAFARARETGGRFEPAILPVLRRGPEARGLVGPVALDAKARTVSFPKAGMGLTLDAFAKGWALDRAAQAARRRGVSIFFNFGGQLLAAGPRAWPVRVPGRPETFLLREASLSTSGNSEQPGHIVDPKTGERLSDRPAASVLAPTGAEADAWSTAEFIVGPGAPAPGRCVLFEGTKGVPDACRPYTQEAKTGASK